MSQQSTSPRLDRQSFGPAAPNQPHRTLPNSSGTYRIDDLATGRYYYGSARNLRLRWNDHTNAMRRGTHGNHLLQSIWRDDPNRLAYTVLQEMPGAGRSARLAAEQALLDGAGVGGSAQDSLCMNINPKASAPYDGTKLPEQVRAKISAALKGRTFTDEAKAKMRAAKLGRKLSLEQCRKLSEANKGRPGPKHTPEMLAKFRKHPPELVAEFRVLIASGMPVWTAAKRLGISRATSRRIADGESYVDAPAAVTREEV